jgi:gamma-glutamyl-gamma-aminobutyrate hydrolase PuuD
MVRLWATDEKSIPGVILPYRINQSTTMKELKMTYQRLEYLDRSIYPDGGPLVFCFITLEENETYQNVVDQVKAMIVEEEGNDPNLYEIALYEDDDKVYSTLDYEEGE